MIISAIDYITFTNFKLNNLKFIVASRICNIKFKIKVEFVNSLNFSKFLLNTINWLKDWVIDKQKLRITVRKFDKVIANFICIRSFLSISILSFLLNLFQSFYINKKNEESLHTSTKKHNKKTQSQSRNISVKKVIYNKFIKFKQTFKTMNEIINNSYFLIVV